MGKRKGKAKEDKEVFSISQGFPLLGSWELVAEHWELCGLVLEKYYWMSALIKCKNLV